MALDPKALVSVEEVRTYLGVGEKDKPLTAWIELVVNGLSARVWDYTGHTYISDDAGDKASARVFSASAGAPSIPIDDCREISKVEVTATPDQAGSWDTWTEESWIAEPLGGPTFTSLRFFNPDGLPAQGTGWGALGLHLSADAAYAQGSRWPGRDRAEIAAEVFVRVTAKWGYGADESTVPADVKLAVLMWLQNIHKRDQAFFNKATSARVFATQEMPPDVKAILDGEEDTEPTVMAV